MPRKSKYTHISLTKKAAWKAFSAYIRARDKYICFTCGRYAEGSGMHAGHFISRIKTSILYHEKNCHAQCYACNVNKGGRWDDYYIKMQNVYGQETIDELMGMRDDYCKRDIQDHLDIEDEYKEKLKNL